jgi:DNA-directed RNA polymerase subunit RPC12/RpoP
MEIVIVKKGDKLYKSMWISQLVLKCGSCLRGVISPYFTKKMECKVCGARIVYGKEAEAVNINTGRIRKKA